MKVIFDTNILIFFVISNKLDYIDKLLKNKKIQIIFSDELINEFLIVTVRDKFKKYFNTKDVINIINYLNEFGIKYKIKSNLDLCEDKKDNYLLNLAIDSKSDYLITGDKLLLKINKIGETNITTFSYFKELFN